jgi:hypothetical protein
VTNISCGAVVILTEPTVLTSLVESTKSTVRSVERRNADSTFEDQIVNSAFLITRDLYCSRLSISLSSCITFFIQSEN